MEQLVEYSAPLKGNTLGLVVTNIPERAGKVTENGRLCRSGHAMILTILTMGTTCQEVKRP